MNFEQVNADWAVFGMRKVIISLLFISLKSFASQKQSHKDFQVVPKKNHKIHKETPDGNTIFTKIRRNSITGVFL